MKKRLKEIEQKVGVVQDMQAKVEKKIEAVSGILSYPSFCRYLVNLFICMFSCMILYVVIAQIVKNFFAFIGQIVKCFCFNCCLL